MKLSATVKEAVADVQVEISQETVPKRVLVIPDLEHAETAVLNSPDVSQWPANLRPRHPRVRRLVLF